MGSISLFLFLCFSCPCKKGNGLALFAELSFTFLRAVFYDIRARFNKVRKCHQSSVILKSCVEKCVIIIRSKPLQTKFSKKRLLFTIIILGNQVSLFFEWFFTWIFVLSLLCRDVRCIVWVMFIFHTLGWDRRKFNPLVFPTFGSFGPFRGFVIANWP